MSVALFKQLRELAQAVAELKEATAELKRRVAELEARPVPRPAGRPARVQQ